ENRRGTDMKRWRWWGLVCLLLCTQLGGTAPVETIPVLNLELPGLSYKHIPLPFKGGERALVIASGNGNAPLGLYVFDEHGNCVAKDEASVPATLDDFAVECVLPYQGEYTSECRNAGLRTNPITIA